MHRVDSKRGQDGPHLLVVILVKPGEPLRLELVGTQKADVVFGQLGNKLGAPAFELGLHHGVHPGVDGPEGFRCGAPVYGAFDDVAFDLLLDSSHAHFKELVQIGADDAEELDPFQQGIFRIQHLREHPLVELEPA